MNIDKKDAERGLYGKFKLSRADGDPTGKHAECDYFVLDMVHDPFARPALEAYAAACEHDYPHLAADIRARLTSKIPWDLRPDDEIARETARGRYNEPS